MKKVLHLLHICLLLLMATGCNPARPCDPVCIKVPPCFNPCKLRRPDVMCDTEPVIKTYPWCCRAKCCPEECCPEDVSCIVDQDCGPLCGDEYCCREVPPPSHYRGDDDDDDDDETYRLAVGDLLEIAIFGDEETAAESVVVAPDGKVYYAFLDGVVADGKTVLELSKDMAPLLNKLYLNPQVSVTLKTAVNRNFKILGRVTQPGEYAIYAPITLREAIGEAGGIQKESYEDSYHRQDLVSLANLKASFIVRHGRKLDVDFEKLLTSPDIDNDIPVKPGDYIYIAPNETQDIYVLGAIRSPMRIGYLPNMTLMQALASVGAWTIGSPYGPDLTRVLIIRGNLQCPCVAQVNIMEILRGEGCDIILQPGDIVYAQDKPWRLTRELIRIAVNAFIQAFVTGWAGWYGQNYWFIGGTTVIDEGI